MGTFDLFLLLAQVVVEATTFSIKTPEDDPPPGTQPYDTYENTYIIEPLGDVYGKPSAHQPTFTMENDND
jgi:hypothetical protein